MAVLFNPVYLVLVCMVGAAAFVVHSLGLWRPLLQAANGVSGVAGDHVHRLLVEAVNRTEPSNASTTVVRRRNKSVKKDSDDGGEEVEMAPIASSFSASSSIHQASSPDL
ncbi:hypothetical protein GGI00_003347 [Coemansia sp. RSA 2681]|nr:hypothetical protein GGI00_003347 [Coemansia sp. RSA 2681]